MIQTITISTYILQVKELLIGLSIGILLGLLIFWITNKIIKKRKVKKFFDLRQEIGKVHLKLKDANDILIQLHTELKELD